MITEKLKKNFLTIISKVIKSRRKAWDEYGSKAKFCFTRGLIGQAMNTLSFTMSLFGTSAVNRTLELHLTLLMFPNLYLCVIMFVCCYCVFDMECTVYGK